MAVIYQPCTDKMTDKTTKIKTQLVTINVYILIFTHTLFTFFANNLHLCTLQSKEVGIQMQDELLKVTTELQTVRNTSY